MERRIFLERIVQFCSFFITGLFALPIFRFVNGSLTGKEEDQWYAILNLDADVSEEMIQVGFNRVLREGWLTRTVEESVWVRKTEEGVFLVFEPYCTHLGCAVSWNSKKRQFHCPCHGGKFDINGNRIAGPPPKPLRRYQTKVEQAALWIRRMKDEG